MLVGWWVLVGGAVVGLGEVGSGGVAATALLGLFFSWRTLAVEDGQART